jgi:hypothetical protein
VAIYGGFGGSETDLSQRNWLTNVVMPSGEIGTTSTDDNSYHVVTGATGAKLDGVTITGSNANGTEALPCFNRCGGGMYNSDSSPVLSNVTFSGNTAAFHGGGMHNYASSNPTRAASVAFRVTFNMPVTGVSTAAFDLSTSGGQGGASITSVTGSGATWTVTVATVTTALGTIRLDLHDTDGITATTGAPASGSIPLGGTGAGNGDFTTGEVYTIGYPVYLPLVVR